ncbi:Beta-ketoacyl synthase, N-terminal domain [Bacillus sp. OV322]|uniref:beta-ketoacyl synthase N-terminal-like domain-containing protein n=1 Tax=Bacillus sp. OV322 TaxID=1882764 RepID=UPI0008E59D58|nr:beta-ketoacyl synthase N-terminal-like domain-containing protein [Bacillus sp. OV322]SFC55699.1 Beta-ketoacyl synthase, N-terminal domain [Bacillus sp. OV322]
MDNRRVVIVDYVYDFPNKGESSNHDIEQWIEDKDKILKKRMDEMERIHHQKFEEYGHSFDGVFYPSIDEVFMLDHIPDGKKQLLLSSEKITLSLFQRLLDRNEFHPKSQLLLTVGTANTDSHAKSTLMNIHAAELQDSFDLADPLGYLKLLKVNHSYALQSVSEASTSGIGAMHHAYLKIKSGDIDCAITGGSSAITFPVPYELSHFGRGKERFIGPFEQDASGHFFSEGGAAFLIKERQQALQDGDRILGEITDISFGPMGNAIMNRQAVKNIVLRSFERAGLNEQSEVFLELYGRGNEIDDSAEFSCLRNIKKKFPHVKGGYLKEKIGYVIGYYGFMGLCRLLDSKKRGISLQGSQIHEPNKLITAADEEIWTRDAGKYDAISSLFYSMHGNSYNLLMKFKDHSAVTDRREEI